MQKKFTVIYTQITDQVNKQLEINNELIINLNTVADSVNRQQNKFYDLLSNITSKTNNKIVLQTLPILIF